LDKKHQKLTKNLKVDVHRNENFLTTRESLLRTRYCSDNNPKTVKRIFLEDGKPREYFLCINHSHDPDFQDYLIESNHKVRKWAE